MYRQIKYAECLGDRMIFHNISEICRHSTQTTWRPQSEDQLMQLPALCTQVARSRTKL